MDLRKLPLGIEVADPEAPLLGSLGRWSSKTLKRAHIEERKRHSGFMDSWFSF